MVKEDRRNTDVDQSGKKTINAMTPEEIKRFHQKTYEKYIRVRARERERFRNK